MNTGIFVDLDRKEIRLSGVSRRFSPETLRAWVRPLYAIARSRASRGVVEMTLEDIGRIPQPRKKPLEHAALVADVVWRCLPDSDRAALARMAQTNADNTVLAMYDALWRALLQEPDIMLINALWERARDETRQRPA